MAVNQVCIAQADSGMESEHFWKENGYYDENQWRSPGITRFSKAMIDVTIARSKKAKWAIQQAVSDPRFNFGDTYWVKRLEEVDEWVIYDIYVNLNDTDYTFWKLKYEHS